jgi:hypothetical protein
MLKRIFPFLLLALVTAACQGDGPTVPAGDPSFAKGGIPGKPGGEPGESVTAEVKLCAKMSVVDAINAIDEQQDPEPWDYIYSPTYDCERGDQLPGYYPEGTLTYSTVGPEFKWKFRGDGFIPRSHNYVLILYPDPWPGKQDLICLEGWEEKVKANLAGKIRFSGSMNLGTDLENAEAWIVRLAWVDCDGQGFLYPWGTGHENPHRVPALTNDKEGDGTEDATWTCARYGPSGACIEDVLAYDWLFPATGSELITYDDTDAP